MKTTATTTTSRRNGHRGWRASAPPVPAAIRGEASLPRLATLPAGVVLEELGVDAGGLSHDEAGARLEHAGPNRLRSWSSSWRCSGFVYLGPMQALLGHEPLSLAQWLPVLAAPVLLFAAEETRKAVVRRHRRAAAGRSARDHRAISP
jgi:hypothetical protein